LKNEFKNSKSQSLQDLFVLSYLNFKKKSFFVEIGAADESIYLIQYCWKKNLSRMVFWPNL